MKRNRKIYFLAILAIVFMGLTSRTNIASDFISSHFGDYLYAVLVFLLFGWLLIQEQSYKILIITLLFCYSIEFLQLYQPNSSHWFNSLKSYKISNLILGNSFQWNDILYYTFGGMSAYFLEKKCYSKNHK